MKKITVISFLATGFIFAVLLIMNPQPVSGSGSNTPAEPGTALPDSVLKVVKKACMDCHSADGSSMARSKVNFSAWASYDAEKQAKKAGAICKELSKGDMPPKKWRANNPDDIPTQAEVDMICKWANSLKK